MHQAARISALKRGVAPSVEDAVEEDAEEEAAAAADLLAVDAELARATEDADQMDDDEDELEDDDDGDVAAHREAEQAAEALFRGGADAAADSGAAADGDAASEQPAWQRELDAFQAEVARRAEAGEDLSFLADANAPEPPWVTQLLASRALENYFSAEAIAELEQQRDEVEAALDGGEGGEGGDAWQHEHGPDGFEGSPEEGYPSMEALMAALAREKGPEAAVRATVFGPDPPPPRAGGGRGAQPPPSASAR